MLPGTDILENAGLLLKINQNVFEKVIILTFLSN